jgi:gas vesicle protein
VKVKGDSMNAYGETFDSHNTVGAVSAFVIGAAVGAAAALILAPVSGRDTRAYLKRRSNELGRDAMERGKEIGRDAMERGKETLRSQSDRVKSAINTGWDRAGEAVSHMREHGEAAYRESRESFESGEPGATRTSYQRTSE